MNWVAILSGSVGGLALVAILWRCCYSPKLEVKGKHVLITGGSKGLGKSLAQKFVALGAKVTIMARNQEALQAAAEEISRIPEASTSTPLQEAVVHIEAVDVMDEDLLQAGIASAVEALGRVDFIVPCAGTALTGKIMDRSTADFRKEMELNYMGVIHVVRAILPSWLEDSKGGNREPGTIVFVASALALTGYVGYSAYVPSKFALRGLAETLRNELLPHNIKVHIAYPGNMDTPGYVIENKTKPLECQAIEDGETTYTPEYVADSILISLARGDFNMYCGDLGIHVLGRAGAGMAPRNTPILDMLIAPFLVPIAYVVRRWQWDVEVTKSKYKK